MGNDERPFGDWRMGRRWARDWADRGPGELYTHTIVYLSTLLLPAAFCCTEFGVKCSAPSCVRLLKFNSAERVAGIVQMTCNRPRQQSPVPVVSRQLATTVDNCQATTAATTATTRTTFWRSDKMSKTDERVALLSSTTTKVYPKRVCWVGV